MTNQFCRECGAPEPGRFCASCGKPQDQPQAARPAPDQAAVVVGAAHPIHPQVRALSGWDVWGGRIERALSFRVGCTSLFAGAIVGALASALWDPLGVPVLVLVAVLCWLGAVLNDEQMAKCDACRKRVKLGATACHHCGYSRNAAS